MIYYYFGSKEKLFVEVLGKIYRDMWEAESALNLDQEDPVNALTQIVQFTMNHYLTHPEMLALLNNENLHKGKYVSKSKAMKELSSPALDLMERIIAAASKTACSAGKSRRCTSIFRSWRSTTSMYPTDTRCLPFSA